MTLLALIRKGGLSRVATATPATFATEGEKRAGVVARVARIAVANSRSLNSELEFFLFKNSFWGEMPTSKAVDIPLRKICDAPMFFRLRINGQWVYFTADGEVWNALKSQGKQVRHPGELFEQIRKDLVAMGFDGGIYDWTLNRIFSLQVALVAFPGCRVVDNPLHILSKAPQRGSEGVSSPSMPIGDQLNESRRWRRGGK